MARIFKKAGRYLFLYAAIIALVALMVVRMPSSFLPSEDQGYVLLNLQLPLGATLERNTSVMRQVEDYSLKQAGSAEHGGRARLQLFGSGPECGAGVCDALRLERTQRSRVAPQLLLPIFDAGRNTAGYLDLLDAQRSLFLVRQAVVQKRLLQLQNQGALYRTLGGG